MRRCVPCWGRFLPEGRLKNFRGGLEAIKTRAPPWWARIKWRDIMLRLAVE
jgi:hypothetical protein